MREYAVVHLIDFIFYHAKDEFDSTGHRCRTIKLLFCLFSGVGRKTNMDDEIHPMKEF